MVCRGHTVVVVCRVPVVWRSRMGGATCSNPSVTKRHVFRHCPTQATIEEQAETIRLQEISIDALKRQSETISAQVRVVTAQYSSYDCVTCHRVPVPHRSSRYYCVDLVALFGWRSRKNNRWRTLQLARCFSTSECRGQKSSELR